MMINFAYPNVHNGKFIGCGRYVVLESLHKEYKVADPNVGDSAKVVAAALRLARESGDTGKVVYERQDTYATHYAGNSQELAYLLALISRSRKIKLPLRHDIWCTGVIEIPQMDNPSLKNVRPEGFDVKLEAFLSEPEPLFIVPASNIQPIHEELCQKQGVSILSLSQFQKLPVLEVSEGKTIVKVQWDELEHLLNELFEEPEHTTPYRGLFPFREQDAEFFFGRETYTQRLVIALEAHSLIAVIGASGSGKSSIVYAGLFPRLRHDGGWLITSFRPGNDPFRNLSKSLIPFLYTDDLEQLRRIKEMTDDFRSRRITLSDVIEQILKKEEIAENFLLFVDQFEELYTMCQDEEERRRFHDELFKVSGTLESSGRVVLTLRADFLGKALSYHPFADVVQQASIILGPMNREELRKAIEEPAATLGVSIEKSLSNQILNEVSEEPENLSFLEFTLTGLWDKRTGRMLTQAAYREIGGVKHALTSHADKIYEGLEPEEQARLPHIFSKLVHPGEGTPDTRRIASRADIGEEDWELVSKLAEHPARLVITTGHEETGGVVEVIHETLITEWQRLREWIDTDRKFLTWQEHLRTTIHQWERNGHNKDFLLKESPLLVAEDWLSLRRGDLSQHEQQFIEVSLRARKKSQQKRKRWKLIVLGVAILLAGIFGVLWRDAETQRRIVVQTSIEAYSVSAIALFYLYHDGLKAMSASVKALKTLKQANDVPEDLRTLVIDNSREIIPSIYEKNRLETHQAPMRVLAFSSDGTILASGSEDGMIILWDVNDGTIQKTLQGHSNDVESIDFSPDNTMLVSGGYDQTIRLWDVKRGKEIKSIQGHSGMVFHVAFSPDGTKLASAGEDGTVKLWNSADLSEIKILQEHKTTVSCVSFSSDGEILASGSDDGMIKLWEVATGKEIRTLKGNFGAVLSVRFSPDKRLLVAGGDNETIKLWKVATGEEIATLREHTDFVASVDFSPDGLKIVSGSRDKTIKLWSVSDKTFTLVRTLQGHNHAVYSVRFSVDGRKFASASWDKTIRLWEIDKPSLPESASLDELLTTGCKWLQDYLCTNPNVSQEDRCLCDDILRE